MANGHVLKYCRWRWFNAKLRNSLLGQLHWSMRCEEETKYSELEA
jgi:hypothetical protein